MDGIEAQEQGKDPYHEVIKKLEHGGRLRLYGKGVTKSTLKKGGKPCALHICSRVLKKHARTSTRGIIRS